VNTGVVGRHLPHPGVVHHRLPSRPATWAADHAAPSPANGFAGLPVGTKVVVVHQGDCLSALAERHLKDWRLDQRIAAPNVGRVQAVGGTLEDINRIYPGWVLVMPANAVGTLVVGTPAAAPVSSAQTPTTASPGASASNAGVPVLSRLRGRRL
jgi:hypothetical protein